MRLALTEYSAQRLSRMGKTVNSCTGAIRVLGARCAPVTESVVHLPGRGTMGDEGMTRCNWGGKKWRCGKLFPTELRDLKGVMVPFKICPHHRALARKNAKIPSAVENRKRNKLTPKGKASQAAYRSSDKRKAVLKKFSGTVKQKVSAKKYYTSEKGRSNQKKNFSKWYSKMKVNDPAKYLMFSLRKKLYKVAKLGIQSQTLSSLTDLDGPSLVRNHFEELFDDGMSWNNYGDGLGKWHIGHRIPVACFDGKNNEDVRRCFAKDNLFPQWSSENHQASVSLPVNLNELVHVFPAKWNGQVPTPKQRVEIEKAAHKGQGSEWSVDCSGVSGSESD